MNTDNQRGEDGREIALEARAADEDRLFSPSVARNKDPIRAAFERLMPDVDRVFEVASGTGEHGAHLATVLPQLHWHPSDPDETSRRSVAAWSKTVAGGRMATPLAVDVTEGAWWEAVALPAVNGVVCINMIHIAPFAATEGLLQGAAALLPPGGRLFLYGPFKRRGATAESNLRFDADLKRRDPSWGVRDLDDQLQPLGAQLALHLVEVEQMPANNLSVVFEKG